MGEFVLRSSNMVPMLQDKNGGLTFAPPATIFVLQHRQAKVGLWTAPLECSLLSIE